MDVDQLATLLAIRFAEESVLRRWGTLGYLVRRLGEEHAPDVHAAKLFGGEQLERLQALVAACQPRSRRIVYLDGVEVGGAAAAASRE